MSPAMTLTLTLTLLGRTSSDIHSTREDLDPGDLDNVTLLTYTQGHSVSSTDAPPTKAKVEDANHNSNSNPSNAKAKSVASGGSSRRSVEADWTIKPVDKPASPDLQVLSCPAPLGIWNLES